MDERLRDVIFEVASQANNHLAWTRELKNSLPKEAFPVFLPAVCCKREDFNQIDILRRLLGEVTTEQF